MWLLRSMKISFFPLNKVRMRAFWWVLFYEPRKFLSPLLPTKIKYISNFLDMFVHILEMKYLHSPTSCLSINWQVFVHWEFEISDLVLWARFHLPTGERTPCKHQHLRRAIGVCLACHLYQLKFTLISLKNWYKVNYLLIREFYYAFKM